MAAFLIFMTILVSLVTGGLLISTRLYKEERIGQQYKRHHLGKVSMNQEALVDMNFPVRTQHPMAVPPDLVTCIRYVLAIVLSIVIVVGVLLFLLVHTLP